LKNYELLTVFKPNLDAEEVEKLLSSREDSVKKMSGKIISTDKVGRKKLAYDIQNFRDGFFVSQILSLPESFVSDFRRDLRLNDNILRTMFTESEKVNA
jgi:small subunit ribosomal protein S6